MNTYKITALRLGILQDLDFSQLVALTNCGQKINAGAWSALIQGNGKNILFDLGIYNQEYSCKHIMPCALQEQDKIENAIKKVANLKPEDIDYIVFSHLHWDHIGRSLRPFTKARFIVQGKEWESMLHGIQSTENIDWAYNTAHNVCLDSGVDGFQWLRVDGWHEIIPGLVIVPLYGHTEGSQGLLVKSETGKTVCLTGDAMNTLENLTLNKPSAITANTAEYVKAMHRIQFYADEVICGHQLTGLEPYQTDGFPKVPKNSLPKALLP